MRVGVYKDILGHHCYKVGGKIYPFAEKEICTGTINLLLTNLKEFEYLNDIEIEKLKPKLICYLTFKETEK